MRDDLYDLMKVYKPEFQYRWNDVIHEGFDAFAEEVATLRPDDLDCCRCATERRMAFARGRRIGLWVGRSRDLQA